MPERLEAVVILLFLITLLITWIVVHLQNEVIPVTDCIIVSCDLVNSTNSTRVPLVNNTIHV